MRSIQTHLVVSLTTGLLLLLGGAGVGLYDYMEDVLENSLDAQLTAKAQAIAGAVHEEQDGQPHLHLPETVSVAEPHDSGMHDGGLHDGGLHNRGWHDAGAHNAGPFYFQIWRADGTTLARVLSPSCGAASMPSQLKHGHRFADGHMPDGEDVRLTRLVFSAQPDDENDNPHAHPSSRPSEQLTMVVAQNRDGIDRALAILLTGLLFAAAMLVTGILLIVAWGVRSSLTPLAQVGQLADQIGPDSLNLRFPAGKLLPDELRPIAAKLNELLDRVATAFAHERRFSAAVAHELRTPVSELLSLCEVTLRWPDDKDALINALKEAKTISSEMGTVVENLMSLARCQAGAEKPLNQVIELSAFVQEIWAGFQSRAADRNLRVEFEMDGNVQVRTDRRLLEMVLRNLLANAVEYTDADGRIRIVAQGSVLKIGNSATSLQPADLPHLAEAFWRKDAARTGGNHAGLGLSLVTANCQVAGIGLDRTLGDDGWFEVKLSFARADEASTLKSTTRTSTTLVS
jgi:two-component system sensor histidine kinase QseC